ncbi:DUF4301 family protein [Flavobacteriaceae bacterium 14752]|uniref:DUF4301 family protein n=1 Tax=Mesohalobacter salilacus TaxID=2491711 RepID=UPI000F6447AC|nr:DUF4301 family protein [Flavobacteriaceae bacterium 14752]
MQLPQKDKTLIETKGISETQLSDQLETFQNGIPFVKILDYAHLGKGIKQLSDQDKNEYYQFYENSNIKVIKFIPASGAASRMFRLLHQFLDEVEINEKKIQALLKTEEFLPLNPLIHQIDRLAFYEQAKQLSKQSSQNFENYSQAEQAVLILKTALSEKGLNLDALPKGLIPFHNYGDKIFTPFEEHLEEAKSYTIKNNNAQLHFTISEEHENNFIATLKQYLKSHNKENIDFEVNFSYQKPSTDTVAVNLDNTPYRDENGQLFFRPGGHGALIHNLNEINADLIFIKNIDNVSKKQTDKRITTEYKKVLAGVLLKLQNKIFGYQKALEQNPTTELIEEVQVFAQDNLNIKSPSHKACELLNELHRPIRVCGMVKNDGDPGGGPFWVEGDNAEQSLQIVETSQVDPNDEKQQQILKEATHFNPVDIVCGVKDYKGQKFDLKEFVNAKRGFICQKSIEGQDIKALELPGLWNGGMAHWHSIFVEVPLSTFNPVKTVVDLLKPAHQDH